MDLSDKIKQILLDKNITPSIFADEIGIQRSSMSHILAGRNKPSLDIVQKIVKRFPELGLNWILDDEDLPKTQPETKPGSRGRSNGANLSPQIKPATERKRNQEEKTIERVLIFYTDGSYKEFKEAK
jgi:transcriptional regulator with XRE-family HTH domain